MIIKATRLQAWAPAGGGGKSRPLPTPEKKFFLTILGTFLLLFLHMGAFLLRFCHFGCLLATFYFRVYRPFFGLAPPSKISAGAHDCKDGSRACSPEIFWRDRNLVSSGLVLLRFCLKNEKNNDKL